MTLSCLPFILFCLAPPPEGALEIANPRGTYGHLGATKPKDIGILPGDTAYFGFEIKNLKFDANGKASYSVAIEIRDADGKIFYEQRPRNSIAQNFLGGNSLPCAAFVEVPLDAKPGAVDWKVTVVDRATKQSTSLSGKGKVLPADFGIVQVGLFADAEARAPVSAVAVVGDSVYLRLAAVGFARDKDRKQPHVKVSMRIIDEKGQPTMPQPIVGTINADVPETERMLPVQFGITLNRPGRFTIELTAEDAVSGKQARVSYRLRVLQPE
jgi:hypothetical protein